MHDVYQVIEDRKGIYLDWLVRLCRQPSIAAQNKGMTEAAQIVEDLARGIGASVRQVSTRGFPVIYGEIGGTGEPTVSFYDHYDVQPPDPLELWESDPFDPVIRDDTLYARGVSDNKGNLVARLAAADAYLRARGGLPVNVKFIFEGEEEIGSPNLADFADAHTDLIQADGCIWEAGYCDVTGRREIYLGVKGILYVELRAQQANTDLHSQWAAIVPSGAWRLINALQTLKDDDDRILISGFYDNVLPTTPADFAALGTMPFDEAGRRQQLGLDAFINGLTGPALMEKYVFQPTANICGIVSGYTDDGVKTVLPHAASCKIDFRLVPNQDPQRVFSLLKQHLIDAGFEDIEVTLQATLHPARTPTEHPFAHVVAEGVRAVYNHDPIVYPLAPGSGPMYDLCQKHGISAVSIGVGNENSRNHAPNENIRVQDYYDGIKHIAFIINHFGDIG